MKRYEIVATAWKEEDSDGEFVRFKDAQAEIDRLNKACDQRAAHEYKLMGDVGMLVAINSELLAGLESMLDEHQALTSSAFKLHGEIRALIAKARGDL